MTSQRNRLFRAFFSRGGKEPTARRRRNLFRPSVEPLETRRLLAGVELISAAHPDLLSATAGGISSLNQGAVSADGRYVAFVSNAPNLVAGFDLAPGVETPIDIKNVYRFDRETGEVVLVSVNAAGTGGGDYDSDSPVISGDGAVVAFRSSASN